ncbi:MAG TPA: alcohol dehydrogenase [Gordonibacter urolithinfaciens]|uniref:Alcohol dehydrogenase n=1 Tax=Gordonibacter urolithinfaciens TaxID=1335613 RepID=A0A6N8IK46_9ACTN|nr:MULTISPECIES: alcohol dehydrogenase [Gordonibacter]MDN4510744.1 alcohol dehydrogenase [Gordonibacter sp. RACS_AR49]MVM55778.1 alcohol dehydrogenase [Gordonibacter urolithinfaciens]MVN16261.1 alcohol dehydrogenase [Gordonibacter urolithinfaciens]MVN39589.1 alcohol dehydrogenase [Gordonibacter urolithinfaciens]MVN57050.1 alcohol dehydrogenase [Gordonibacter urolithinfaciens]
MSVKSREKIALFVFLALIVLSLCGLGWYLVAGHSWNVAASNLDDTFGSMDGYTAIVYPGTAVEPVAGKGAGDAVGDAADGKESAEGAAAGKEADAGSPDAPGSSGGKDATGTAGTASAPGTDAGESLLGSKKKTLSAQEAKEGYEEKGATVFSLDTVDLDAYREGVILKKGGHRFGVFGIAEPTSTIVLEKQIAYFKRHKVDFIVLVTPDKEYAEDVSGIDIVVSTQDEDLFVMGETIDGTFYVDAPAVGSVGAILISPSNVVSAKVLQAS